MIGLDHLLKKTKTPRFSIEENRKEIEKLARILHPEGIKPTETPPSIETSPAVRLIPKTKLNLKQ